MKQPILIFHGALGGAAQFASLTGFLAEKGEQIEVIEFEGHGNRPLIKSFTMDTFASNVKDALQRYDVPPLVFGYSMGGYAALLAAIQGANPVGIITLGTKMHWSPEISAAEIRMLNPDKLLEKVPAFVKELEIRHQSLPWRDLLQKTADMMVMLGANPPLTEKNLQEVSVPVLYALGDRDEMVGTEETLNAYRQTPGAACSLLPGTRHPIEKVDPELIYFLILQWRKLAAKYPTTQKAL